MRVALGQINPIIGDYSYNQEKISHSIKYAHTHHADIIVFPEMAICGYPAMDLWLHASCVQEHQQALTHIAQHCPPNIHVVVGHVAAGPSASRFYNAASVLYHKNTIFTQAKTYLPNYDIFDERRYFVPATQWGVFKISQVTIGIAICEDIWEHLYTHETLPNPIENIMQYTPHVIVIPSASPYFYTNLKERFTVGVNIAKKYNVGVVYVNCVGAQDSIIFDGHSFVIDRRGNVMFCAPGFTEDCSVVSLDASPHHFSFPPEYTCIRKALSLGIRDYITKTQRHAGNSVAVHLGLSGGIDSALVLVLASEALGSQLVHVLLMPTEYTSLQSTQDALRLLATLGISHTTINIDSIRRSIHTSIDPHFLLLPTAQENIQARIRGVLLMAYANSTNSITLVTGNKSEFATGYSTMYGDTAGALAVIGDLYKTQVYELACHINASGEIIPQSILEKAPSAELRHGQKDIDSLPPYHLLDPILKLLIEEQCSVSEVVSQGHDHALVQKVATMVANAEYKRAQAPPVLKVSSCAFGIGRRMPIVT